MDRVSPPPPASDITSDTLRRFTRFLQEIGQLSEIRSLAERILHGLLENASCLQGAFYLHEQRRSGFECLATQGIAPSDPQPPSLALSHPLIHVLNQRQEILDASGYLSDGLGHTSDKAVSPPHLCRSLAVPLIARGQLIALVLLQSESPHVPLSQTDLDLLTAMAQVAAFSVDALLASTNLRQCHALIRHTDRLRSLNLMARGVAHEIKNPLTSIKTFIQLTPERKDDAEFIREFSRVVVDDVHRIDRLVQEILDYASDKESTLLEEDINAIVSSCLSFIGVKARNYRIQIQRELLPGLPRVVLGRQQIKQALLNIFLNTIEAMSEGGGRLRVQTSTMRDEEGHTWVQLEIEETGPGTRHSDSEHIGPPSVFTAHDVTADNLVAGWGLTIADQIIREHRGSIHVTRREGAGRLFRIILPPAQ